MSSFIKERSAGSCTLPTYWPMAASLSGETHSVEKFEHSGFAVLQICLSHFETIGHYERRSIPPNAKGSNGYFFKEGVRSVFPQLLMGYGGVFDELLARLYSGARCGLYHNSMTVKDVGLGQPAEGEPLAYDSTKKRLAISPERLPRVLKTALGRVSCATSRSKQRRAAPKF